MTRGKAGTHSAAETDERREQVNKRLTLNLLIQGSAQHAFLTSHYLVRDELNAIYPELVNLYDRFALAGFLQYWYGMSVLISGGPVKFWRRVGKPGQPFARHPFLVKHGGALAEAARQRALERAKKKGVSTTPVVFSILVGSLAQRCLEVEAARQKELTELARRATHLVWGISVERLDAALTRDVAFGNLRKPDTVAGRILRASAVGYGGVVRHDGELKDDGDGDGDVPATRGFRVKARAWMWPLLSHELVKGTAELICLHGLNTLDDETYADVLKVADRIEYEPWMLQAGSELWRQLLPLLPNDRPASEVLMHIARLPPRALDSLVHAVVEKPEWAKELLAGLPRE